KFAMDVRELDIDLIDSINPFSEAYAILGKTMSEESLKQVAAVISARMVQLTPEEARHLAKRALNKDEAGRRTTETTAGPLFAADTAEGDEASGTIYALRSEASLPLVAESRNLVHKIGVTNMEIERRVAGAHLQPTFLMAGVEVVATYELFNINRTKLENLIHRIFAPARLDIEVMDRFGNLVVPREWFLAPLYVIDEAVDRIRDGSIKGVRYDPVSASLVELQRTRGESPL
ncbi:MAG: GIY-YIG nuclease family protein, partial [Pseudomonadota bacterium]